MCDVTVVCCWNNEELYGGFVNSLKVQDTPCEIIGIDNRDNKNFTSCAAAYNSVINQVKTKYVIYSHQDILLNDTDALGKFVSYLGLIGKHGILGVAGVLEDRVEVFTNIKHRWNSTGEISYAGHCRVEGNIMEGYTVDECFFGGCTEHFRDEPFDEVICDNWHLYAADACLNTRAQSEKRREEKRREEKRREEKRRAYICDVTLLHLSSGSFNPAFYWGFYRLCRKYSRVFSHVRTTCASSRTDILHLVPSLICQWTRSKMNSFLYHHALIHKALRKAKKFLCG